MIKNSIQEIETYLTKLLPKKPNKWLQEGICTDSPPFQPVTPESESP